MNTIHLQNVARYEENKHVHVQLYNSDQVKVLLLCLNSGLAVPPHSHQGLEITLIPVKGKANLPLPDGTTMLLEPGMFVNVDGATLFNPSNPFPEKFEMIIHLVKKTS